MDEKLSRLLNADMDKAEADIGFMSPEGVEERIVYKVESFITLTQGGKYRAYISSDIQGTGGNKVSPGPEIYDTEEAAKKAVGSALTLIGMMIVDPERGAEILLKSLGNPSKPPPSKDH